VHTWLKHLRRQDPLFQLDRDAPPPEPAVESASGIALDLNRALAQLAAAVRLCVVLAYHEGLSHSAIADITGLPLGTVKSHISRGSAQLRNYLAAYETQRSSP
jgi:RNA polymerase sigma-70 factor (ECF subfamily)